MQRALFAAVFATVIATTLVVSCTDLDLGAQRWHCEEWDDCPPGERCLSGVCRPEMVLVPAGPFRRGCDPERDGPCARADAGDDDCANAENATPSYEVSLSAYRIDVTEVTVESYGWCVEAGECEAPAPLPDAACNWGGGESRAELPMNCVRHDQAEAFCESNGKRLCTEAQWEKAARGTDGRTFPWGDGSPTAGALANCREDEPAACRDGFAGATPVGAWPAGESPYGVVDLAGNVSEWVRDWHSDVVYAACVGVGPSAPCLRDPVETEDRGLGHVVRGGNFANPISCLRTYSRTNAGLGPGSAADWLGFRCCGDGG